MSSGRNWAQELEDLKKESALLEQETRAIQQEISDMFGPQESSMVRVTLDDLGLISSIDVDSELASAILPEQLVLQTNHAIASAVAQRGVPLLPSDPDSSVLEALLQGLTAGSVPEPQLVSNDLKTVTVSAVLGSITRVDCDLGWVSTASLTSFGSEVVRVARLAAIQTDTLGKYSHGGAA